MRRYQGEKLAIKARVLGAMGAVVAATQTNARLLGLDGEIGTIEHAKQADLIAVDGDVLADPSLFGRPQHLLLVMRGGRVWRRGRQ